MREPLDHTDRRLTKLLSSDGQGSVNELADKLQVSPPTVRARLKLLIGKQLLKVVGLLNLSERPELIAAIVITAYSSALGLGHLKAVGIDSMDKLHIMGLEHCAEWNRIFAEPDAEIDLDVIEQEVLGTARRALMEHPGIRAFVLECTDLPPYSAAIRQQTGLPVFDFITMANYLHSAV